MDRPRILIVEDNPISRKVLKKNLESENYLVVETTDGASALLEAKKQKFDLIIQDLILPDMDGFILNQKLRQIPGLERIPIFALSGFLSQVDIQSRHPGFTAYLFKPVEPSYLRVVVRAHLPVLTSSDISAGNRKHILIADDNAIQLKLFSMQLENLGFEVTTASDGVVALKEARSKQPDVIISDILMPNLDGFGLCLEVKRDPKLRTIPIMLLSSHYIEDEDLALAKKVGANCYLTRTPDIEKLISELMKILHTESSFTSDVPLEVTEEIKEKHAIRSVHQLEQQVLENTKLAQRCALLMSQLSLVGGIANALTTSGKDINESLKEVIYFCLDATGVSNGALYLKKSDNTMILNQQMGYSEEDKEKVSSLFGAADLIPEIIKKNEPFAVPSKHFSGQRACKFLDEAKVKSALIVPLFSGSECLGILFLGSDLTISGEDTREFVHTLGMQFGLSIALASAFDKLGSSEKRFRQLVEISPDAIFIQQDGKFVYSNTSALKLLGAKNSDELLIHSFYKFFLPDFQKVIKYYIEQNEDQDPALLFEGNVINLKGDILDVEMVLSPFLYQERSAVYMIMRDITERKRSALHLEIQYAIAWILAESATLFVATAKILKIICERLQWDCGTIWAVDQEANVLRCTRVWQMPEIYNDEFQELSQNMICPPGIGLPGKAWQKRKVIWRSDILNNENMGLKDSINALGLNTAVAFPIIYEDKVLGVIQFLSKRIVQPNTDILLWFESIGNQFGLFLMRKHMETQMLYLAEHDVLTGLSNRKLLEQYLNTALTAAEENNQLLAVLFLDLDHFKYVNDSMGHQAGDILLKEISKKFRQCLRAHDIIGRLGGDEFVIILPNMESPEKVVEIINRLQHQLSTQTTLKEKDIFITASIGISLYPRDGTTVQTLIKCADIAMYAAKRKGRNNYQFCTHEMTATAENQGILQNNLRQALENEEFILYYQPKIDVATKNVVGMEALIRWQRPSGLLLPGSFIAAAENSDLIIPIGEWVLKTACIQNKEWQIAGLPTITMSVNLSVRNLNKQLLEVMQHILTEVDLKPNSFEVELTESVLMQNVENNIQILQSLHEMGIKISIDDFGTGYSSLSYLKRFPIDTIKIDKSFVNDIATDPDDAAIVTAIIAMAHSLNFKVIAEGVETEAQLKFLCKHGCDEIQGFYFCRALPAADAADFMKNAHIDWNFDK